MNLSRGQRAKIVDLIPNSQSFTVSVTVNAPDLIIDFSCFGLDAQSKLSDERYMTFFNQPSTPCGGVSLTKPSGGVANFAIDLAQLPPVIERLAITATLDGDGTMSRIASGYACLLNDGREVGRFTFKGADFAEERALMLLEFYRKDGIWRVSALGQGFNGGLAALVRHFGGEVAPEAAATPPPKPAVNLSKITLEKRGNTVSLDKKEGTGHSEILINLNWNMRPARTGFFSRLKAGNIDLDLGCLYELKNGEKNVVQALGNAFGNYHNLPYIVLDADDRTGACSEGENLRINGKHWDEIRRVLVYAFIYEGVPNWSEADAIIKIKSLGQPEIEVRLDSHRNDHGMCGIAMLENQKGSVCITKLVDYRQGHADLDNAYRWGMKWVHASKD